MATPATPADASSGAEVDVDRGQKLHAGNGGNNGESGGADDPCQRLYLRDAALSGRVLLGDADHASVVMRSKRLRTNRNKRNDDQMRQLGADELLGVENPFIHHFAHETVMGNLSQTCQPDKWMHTNTPLSIYTVRSKALSPNAER